MAGGKTKDATLVELDAPTLTEFRRELAHENYRVLTRSAVIFGTVYVLWGAYDYFLVPEKWQYFLGLRVLAALANAAIVTCAAVGK